MSLDLVDEKSSMLSKCGSFWYTVLSEQDRDKARMLNNLACLTRVNRQLSNSCRAVLSGGYFHDHFRVVRFSDDDIVYNGADAVIKARYDGLVAVDGSTEIPWLTAVGEDNYGRDPHALSPHRWAGYMMLPDEGGDSLVLPPEYMAEFGLRVDRDLLVESIDTGGKLLLNGTDFVSAFGYISFPSNPAAMFQDHKFMARHVVYRKRNILCYTLGLDSVYGPVDRVMHYYRVSQSPVAFRYAAAQACGLAVTRREGRIVRVLPLHSGAAYVMDNGDRYDAPYPHFHLKREEIVPGGTVIGGRELLQMVLPGEDASGVPYVLTGEALPAQLRLEHKRIGLMCLCSDEDRYGVYNRITDLGTEPGNLVPVDGNAAFNGLWEAMAPMDGGPSKWGDDCSLPSLESGFMDSAIDWLRERACNGMCIIVRINEGAMPYDMQIRLHKFITREAPIGSVVAYSPLEYTITERV